MCKAGDDFKVSIDRVLHITRGHVGRVIDADENVVQLNPPKGRRAN